MAESSPLMNPDPNCVGSVVVIARCAAGRTGRTGSPISPQLPCAVADFVNAIILARLRTSHSRDDRLQSSEQADRFQRPIAPAGRDAIVTVVGPVMVRRVRDAAEQNSTVLKDPNRARWRWRVRPLVNLIGENPDAAERQAE